MSREQMLMPKAQRAADRAVAEFVRFVVLLGLVLILAIIAMGVALVRIMPLIVAVFAAIILARCAGVM